ncbi:MFS transporter [Saccharothrix algeriensis]|uniref:MFS family permease n=1 Tax=Saccharothrix algeriensis TaxID=173560 RepID=A0ABS2S251_9PSEU|nr:MFS transporter [Saccharothrix algeriensis]MBM7810307.1 MFS family permease [Saccharothrix algeriensis]
MSSVQGLSTNGTAEGGGGARVWPVLLGAAMVLADTSILNVVAPLIERSFSASVAELQLAVAGYQVAYASVLVIGGRLGDRWGRPPVLRWGLVLFALASLAAGAAGGMGVLIAARLVQGVAAGLLFPQVLAIVRALEDPQARNRALGSLGMVMALATVVAPVVAGVLVAVAPDAVGWRLIFLVNLPVCLLVWWLAVRGRAAGGGDAGGGLDAVGGALTAATIAAIAVPLTLGRSFGWPVWAWVVAVAAVPLAVGYGVYEQRRYAAGRQCIVPIGAFRDPTLLRGVFGYLLFFAASTCFFLYFSLLLQTGADASPLVAGLALAPYGVGAAVTSRLSARLTGRWEPRLVVAAGAAVCVVGTALTGVLVWALPAGALAYGVAPALLVTGAGLGLVVAPVLGVVLSLAPPSDAGAVGGALTTGQQIGGALGIVVFGLFFPLDLGGVPHEVVSTAFLRGLGYEAVLFAAVALLFLTAKRRGAT